MIVSICLPRPFPSFDILGGLSRDEVVRVQGLREVELYSMKLNYGLKNPIVDIGLFGSSRAMMANAVSLNLTRNEFFNFSVIGSNNRTSFELYEQLISEGKAPKYFQYRPSIHTSGGHTVCTF